MSLERLKKILRGSDIAPKTSIEAAVKKAMNDSAGTVTVPITIEFDGEGHPTASSTMTFEQIKGHVEAGKTMKADVLIDAEHSVYIHGIQSATAYTDGELVTIIFSLTIIMNPERPPELYQVNITAVDITVANAKLTVAED